jgi:anti-anti-sigma factor
VLVRTEFAVDEMRDRGWARISVKGDLDMSSAPELRRRLRAFETRNTNVSVDLSHVEFIDAAGAGAVIDAVTHASQSSTWCVLLEPKMAYQPRRVFDLLKEAGDVEI